MSTPDTTGYNEAERQFHEKDQEALKALRAQLDRKRADAKAAAEKAAHWMRCPKCGGQMKEVAMGPVVVDQCGSCGGVYFDAGELDALTKSGQASPAVSKLISWLPSWRVSSDAKAN